MKDDKGFRETEMSVIKRILFFPVWLGANIYTVLLLFCAALVPLAIIFAVLDWIRN